MRVLVVSEQSRNTKRLVFVEVELGGLEPYKSHRSQQLLLYYLAGGLGTTLRLQ